VSTISTFITLNFSSFTILFYIKIFTLWTCFTAFLQSILKKPSFSPIVSKFAKVFSNPFFSLRLISNYLITNHIFKNKGSKSIGSSSKKSSIGYDCDSIRVNASAIWLILIQLFLNPRNASFVFESKLF